MKHSGTDSTFQTNLLQALQKNKIIQGKLTECQNVYYMQLLKDMQTYNLEEKYNRELLYTWKKESYIRQLKKDLQEYEQQSCGVKDAYYEYQIQKLGNLIGGQQTLVIPQSEEERRLDVNAKYRRFLQKNPLQVSSSINGVKSINIPMEQGIKDESDKTEQEEEEISPRSLEDTWKYVHAKSAVGQRRKPNNLFPHIRRPLTINEIRKNKSSAKSFTTPVSRRLVPTSPEIFHSLSDDKIQRLPTKSASNAVGLSDSMEALNITSEIIDKHTRADLVTMRSVRRPRKNPFEVNLLFETRKRIYQINKRTLDYQLFQRKRQLQQNIQFYRFKPRDHTEELLEKVDENIPKQDENKQQSDTIII
jgi:hypothetical protein